MSDPAQIESDAATVTPHTTTLFWLIGIVVLTVGIGWGLGAGPQLLRRPVLSPIVMGLILGAAGVRLAAVVGDSPRRWRYVVIGLAAATAVLLMHFEIFRQVREAVARQERAAPSIPWTDQLLDDIDASESLRRELRLKQDPTVSDYLAQRAAALFGEVSRPVPPMLLGAEVLAAGAAAIGGYHWMSRRRER